MIHNGPRENFKKKTQSARTYEIALAIKRGVV